MAAKRSSAAREADGNVPRAVARDAHNEEVDLATVDPNEIGKRVFLTDLVSDAPSGLDVARELQAAEELQAEIAAFTAEQNVRRRELEAYVCGLFERKVDGGVETLIDKPVNYDEVIAAAFATVSGPASARLDAAADALSAVGSDVDWTSAFEYADDESTGGADDEMSRGLATIRRLDARLARVARQAQALAAERAPASHAARAPALHAAREPSGAPAPEFTDELAGLQESGAVGPSSAFGTRARARATRGEPGTDAVDKADDELVARVLARSDAEEAVIAAGGGLSTDERARLAAIDAQLGQLCPQPEWGATRQAAAVAAFESARARRDYLRMQRINREQRDRLRLVETRLRAVTTGVDGPANSELVRALLLDALAEDPSQAAGGIDLLAHDDLTAIQAGERPGGALRALATVDRQLSLEIGAP